MDRVCHIGIIFEVDGNGSPLLNFYSRSGNHAVVGEHPHLFSFYFFLHKSCREVKGIAIFELHCLVLFCFGETGGIGRKNAGHRFFVTARLPPEDRSSDEDCGNDNECECFIFHIFITLVF